MRLDIYLYKKNFVSSRSKACELIKSGKIKINGKIILKPSYNMEDLEYKIEILEDKVYVGRAAYKLKFFLQSLNLDIENSVCLDIGSSTGGFTQILLEFKVKEVYAVDVGKDQLHPLLKSNPKVKSFEKTDIREFKCNKKFNLVVCDVSFTGIENILPKMDEFATDKIILLFKPQFEVGKNAKRNKKGVVTDKKAIKEAEKRFEKSIEQYKWQLIAKEESKIKGKEGNVETFYYFRKKRDRSDSSGRI